MVNDHGPLDLRRSGAALGPVGADDRRPRFPALRVRIERAGRRREDYHPLYNSPPRRPVPGNPSAAIADLPVESTAVPHRSVRALLAGALVCLGPGDLPSDGPPDGPAKALHAAEPPRVLRWAGDPEGGAPFVE